MRILDLLLPRRCMLCRERSKGNLCPGCDADLPRMPFACARCALPLERPWTGSAESSHCALLCGQCIRRPPPFDATIAALHYEFPVTVLVQRFKFNRSLACGEVLADHLLTAISASVGQAGPEVGLLVPVPLHPGRQFVRVFNQAEVIARDISRALAIPVAPNMLRRARRTPAQSGLSAKERSRNLRGAFRCRPIESGHIALVDDVMTTGATVRECAHALKRAGAAMVSVWVAARAA